MKHEYKHKESTSIALQPEIREAVIQATNSEWGGVSRFVNDAVREKLNAMGYLPQPEKKQPIVMESKPIVQVPSSKTNFTNTITL